MRKHTHYTQTFSSHAHTHPHGPLCTQRSDEQKRWHYLPQRAMLKWKYRFLGINISTGLWIASKTCTALLRASCSQFEACHGWFLLTGGIISADKTMTDAVDASLVFLGVLWKRVPCSSVAQQMQRYILIPEDASRSQTLLLIPTKWWPILQLVALFALWMLNALQIRELENNTGICLQF